MKRVKIIERKITVKEYYCPSCDSEVHKDCGYCYTCGERLYWVFNKEVCDCNRDSGDIDSDIKQIVRALNNAGIKTIASCCGHTFQPTRISIIQNGVEKELLLVTYNQAQEIGKLFPDINGELSNE